MHKLVSLDNKDSKGQAYVGKEGTFGFYGVCFYFLDINSSRVSSIVFHGEEMTVTTKNSVYVFRKV